MEDIVPTEVQTSILFTHIVHDNSTRQCRSKLTVSVGNQDVILVDVAANLTPQQYSQNVTTKDQVSNLQSRW